ncbi:ABC transporter permease subunit [Acholeplasma hippikon]|uniref:ABC-type transport system involved in multi-copper enzyme maturation, permease component n=1 Tax=Acholeplasma hippikon TaxID=264636 RepID=A0A449BJS3_9MOLU|nr:ABC transporter permease subunit [Acholeplasma hippikon]VEU82699.1 ABC-type transport system involved in multi-copper enzyme maturation, permease component [Acholeplasma hippikon]
MKSFLSFFKKELLENKRSGKLVVMAILFVIFGIMNPLIAKLTPWILELLSDSMNDTGIIIGNIEVNAITSWVQFFKNIPIALIVFVIMYSSIYTVEYENNTLILLLSKGLKRSKVLLAKFLNLFLVWTVGYFICFVITYLYNAYYWDNSIAVGLISAIMMWYLFGVFIIGLMVLFSTISNKNTGVLLGVSTVTFMFYLVGLIPSISKFIPTTLMDVNKLLVGEISFNKFLPTLIITLILVIGSLAASIKVFNKKQL